MFGRRVLFGFALGTLVACTPTRARDAGEHCEPDPTVLADREQADAPAHARVLMTLTTRDHEVTVYSQRGDLRFTVALAGGTLLGDRLDPTEFARSFPTLFENFQNAFAEDYGEMYIHAGL